MKLFILALMGLMAAVNALPRTAEWEDWKKVIRAIGVQGMGKKTCAGSSISEARVNVGLSV